MIYNYFLENILFPLGDFLLGTQYIKQIKYWRKVSVMDEKSLENLQKGKLSKLLSHALENVPYYKDFEVSVDPNNPCASLKNFPIQSKLEINRNGRMMVSKKAKKLKVVTTGGSTGIMGIFYSDKKADSVCNAIQTVWWEWAGYRMGDRLIQTGVMVKRGVVKGLKDFFMRVTYVSAFNLTNDQIVKILKKAPKGGEICLGGYASSLKAFADVAINNKLNVKFKTAITWGDKVFQSYKTKINKAFGCVVYESYGCSEGLMIGAKKDLPYFYIMTPHVVVEILDDEGNEVADGEIGYVVVTSLTNYSMPIIRYRLGDLAVKLPRQEYPAQREMMFPLLHKVIGRNTDIIQTKSGNVVVVQVIETLFEEVEEIVKFKVIQHHIDKLEIQYVLDGRLKEGVVSHIDTQLRSYLDDEFDITWHQVSDIATSPSGKPQFIESRIINVV